MVRLLLPIPPGMSEKRFATFFMAILALLAASSLAEANPSKCLELFLRVEGLQSRDGSDPKVQNSSDWNRLTNRQGPQINVAAKSFSDLENAIQSLARLRVNLDLASASNTSTAVHGALDREFIRKKLELQVYLRENNIPQEKIYELLRAEVEKLQNQEFALEVEREQARNRDKQVIQEFLPESKGKFNAVDGSEKEEPFEMMVTLTSQMVWRQIAELINERLGGVKLKVWGFQKIFVPFKKRKPLPTHQLAELKKGDSYPVMSMSGHQVDAWIEGLNKLSEQGEPELEKIFIGHKTGHRYQLPTMNELQLVLTSHGEDEKLNKLKDFAESNGWTERIPVKIEGKEYYDIIGNIREWTSDHSAVVWWDRFYREAGFENQTFYFNKYHIGHAEKPNPLVGFRLIRKSRNP